MEGKEVVAIVLRSYVVNIIGQKHLMATERFRQYRELSDYLEYELPRLKPDERRYFEIDTGAGGGGGIGEDE